MSSDPCHPRDVPAQDDVTLPFVEGVVSQGPASRIKVLVAHDDPLLAAGIEAALSQSGEFELLACASQRHLAPERQWDVTVADYGTALKMLDVVGRQLRVMVVTPESRETSIRVALERGVRGYLMLGCSVAELRDAVRTVSRGGTALGPLAAAKVAESLQNQRLTSRELEVLRVLMAGLSDKAIAKQLAVSQGTVKSHVKSILSKLAAGSRTEAAAIAQRRGIVGDESLSGLQRALNVPVQRALARSNERERVFGVRELRARPRSSLSALQSSTATYLTGLPRA